jgi:hypothetical protein
MKKVYTFLLYLVILGCTSEKDAGPANSETFLRYFGSEHNHTANMAIEADNGYTLLSTIQIQRDNLGNFVYKIRLIHTDKYGNLVWNKVYPSFEGDGDNLGSQGSFRASAFMKTETGYLIIGEGIKSEGNSGDPADMILIETDLNGNAASPRHFDDPENQGDLHGKAITTDGSDFYVLATLTFDPNASVKKDMYLAKLKGSGPDKYTTLWSYPYGGGTHTLADKLYFNNTDSDTPLNWISTWNDDDISFIRAKQNSATVLPTPYGETTHVETASDFCKEAGVFYLAGKTNKSVTSNTQGDENIYVVKITDDSDRKVLKEAIFDFGVTQNDVANSITLGVDGGIAVLSTVESGSKGNGKKDLYLQKLNGQLEPEWQYNFGGLDDEEGASVIATSDGSYLIYGMVSFGSLKKLMLLKVSKDGKLR